MIKVETNFSFFITVAADGSQRPMISIGNVDLRMLANLASGHLTSSNNVREELKEIDNVVTGSREKHSFGGDDWCILEVNDKITTISNGFDEFESIEIETKEIVNLLEGWCDFLVKYENGEIPGIIPENRKDEWIIVPKTNKDE